MRRLSLLLSLMLFLSAGFMISDQSMAEDAEKDPAGKDAGEGKLDRFEKEAAKEHEVADEGRTRRRHGDDCDDDDDDDLQFLLNTLFFAARGGIGTAARTFGSDSPSLSREFPRREFGEPLIPFLAIEGFREESGVDIAALSLRVEAGYGPFGAEIRSTHFAEESPDDALAVRQVHGLYRMSFSRNVEVDFGVGTTWLNGNSQLHGRSVTVPLRISATRGVGFEVRPSWAWIGGNTVSDVSVLLTGHVDYLAIKAGYRRLAVSGVTLDGPVIGFSVSL